MQNIKFDLTKDEIELSRKLTGVVARVIIPNGNSIEYMTGYTHVFPENYMRFKDAWNWVDKQRKDFTVITNCPGIITSVPRCCVRLINHKRTYNYPQGETYGANIGEMFLTVYDLWGSLIPKNVAIYIEILQDRIGRGEVVPAHEIDIISEDIIRNQLHRLNNKTP